MNKETFLEKVIAEINSSIKFIEAKNVALITLNSALIAWGAGIVFDIEKIRYHRLIVAIAVLALSVPMIIAIISFCPVMKNKTLCGKQLASKTKVSQFPQKLMYYAYIATIFADDANAYLKQLETMDSSGNELAEKALGQQVIDLANVALRKSVYFNRAVRIESLLFFFGVIGTLLFLLPKLFC